jgi:hypothetical protein
MAEKQIKVVIDGEEYVSTATKKAGDAVEGFTEKTSNLLKGLAAMAAGLALGAFFRRAVEEAETSREAMGQLAIAVNNSGASFRNMTPEIDAALEHLARVTKFGDDDFARAMQQMTLKTGDARWALANLGQAADLAAAANIPLEAAADALAKAHEGNTRALFKMLPELKNATNWQELLADKTRGAAEAQMQQVGPFEAIKKQFGEFAEAVGRAILGNENMSESGFGVATMLADMASWIDTNVEKARPFLTTLSSIADNLIKSLSPAFSALGPIVMATFTVIADAANLGAVGIRAFVIKAQDLMGGLYKWLAEKGLQMAGVFQKFGVTINTDSLNQLKAYGENAQQQAAENWAKLEADDRAYKARMASNTKAHQDTLADTTQQGASRRTKIEADAAEQQAKDEKKWFEERKAQLQALWKAIDLIAVGAAETAKTLGPAVKTAFDKQVLDNHVDALEKARLKNAELIKQFTDANQLPKGGVTFEQMRKSISDFSTKTGDVIQTVSDLADTFGLVDDQTKNALTSAGRLVEKIGELMKPGASWSLGGTLGIIGAVGSLVSTLLSLGKDDAERRRILQDNTRKLEDLNKTYGDLAIKQSGDTTAKVQAAMAELLERFTKLAPEGQNTTNFNAMLRSAMGVWGISESQLDEFAKLKDVTIRDKNGRFIPEALLQLAQQLALLQPTIAQSFRDQFDFFKTSQDLSGATGLEKLRGIAEFVGARSPGLKGLFDPTDLEGSFARLFALRTQLNNPGSLTYKDFGQLSGDEFKSVIEELLNGLKAIKDVGGGDGLGTGSGSGTTADVTGGSSTGTGKTLADVVTTITAQTDALAEYHSAHLSIAKDHLEEARLQTDILTEIAKNTAATAAMGIDAAFGKQLAVERRLAGTPSL